MACVVQYGTMGPEISLADVFKGLGLDPRDWCMKIDGIHRVDATTVDESLNDRKQRRGNGCYKTLHHFSSEAYSHNGNSHKNSR